MRDKFVAPVWIAALIAALPILLAGCTATNGPLWGADSSRNGAGQFVDPVLGTPLPGHTMGYN
jgi:hypothetical protein